MAKKKRAKTERVHCNTCKHNTQHRVLKSVSVNDSEQLDEDYCMYWANTYDMLQCCGCDDVRMRHVYTDSESDGTVTYYYPASISRHAPEWQYEVPAEIAVMLGEIYQALGAGCRALTMIGARTLLDLVMLQEVDDIGTFAQKLEALQKKGVISSKNSGILEAALDAGSAAAHRGFAPKTSDVHAVLDIVENLLQSIYVLDDVAKRIKQITPPRQKSKLSS